ncbi:hypothetical protein A3SI_13667 [Nitritalea halalkaliphila LW7]|uniref:Uncharacterized protein n=1 Tax=Nitritalea halalkaliphila LW7 TaxID=1189621 RepID=I5C0U0_9BACT|nr:hypothetical protein [Nitritalea halalkaliphila]EIM75442.1 hypothetical protein A3SI_13667 [Nitritalea halalkaliphila LW7]
MPADEQKKIKAGILKDLLQRDEKELETFKDNAENFRTDEGDAAMMIRRKLSTYKRKVDVKNYILKELSNI